MTHEEDWRQQALRSIRDLQESVAAVSSSLSALYETVSVGPVSQGPQLNLLSRREREVVTYIAQGRTSREVGDMLGLSPRTVEVHRARAMQKLGVHNTVDLLRIYLSRADA